MAKIVGRVVTTPLSIKAIKEKAVSESAPAIKGSKSGKEIVLDDISPIEHELEVKVSAPPKVEEVQTSIPVDISQLKNYDGKLIGTDAINIVGSANQFPIRTTLREMCGDKLSKGDDIIIKFKCDGNPNFGVSATFSDRDIEEWSGGTFTEYFDAPSKDDWSQGVSNLIKVDENVLNGWLLFSVSADFDLIDMRVYDLEIIKIDYTKITLIANDKTYTPQADGTVLGVKSEYPTLTLSTDSEDATISCVYNRDTNKALANAGGGSNVANWEKIVDIKTTEEVNGIVATVEEFPNIPKCKEFVMRLVLPKTETSVTLGTFRIFLNNDDGMCFYSNSISTTTANAELRCNVEITDTLVNVIGTEKASSYGPIVASLKQLISEKFINEDINKIYCKLGTATNMFPIGTKFIIYGKVKEDGIGGDGYTKTEIDEMIGDIETLLGGI